MSIERSIQTHQDEAPVATRSIGPRGASARVLTSLRGYTHVNVCNQGPGPQAEVVLTWVDEKTGDPRYVQIVVNGQGECEYVFEVFHGAKLNITNHSADATVEIALSLG